MQFKFNILNIFEKKNLDLTSDDQNLNKNDIKIENLEKKPSDLRIIDIKMQCQDNCKSACLDSRVGDLNIKIFCKCVVDCLGNCKCRKFGLPCNLKCHKGSHSICKNPCN